MRISLYDYMVMEERLKTKSGRKTPPTPADAFEDESDLHGAIEQECKRRGWITIRARMDKRSTIRVGAPDFVILGDRWMSQCASCPFILFVECKSKTGKLRPEQLAFHAWAEKLGHKIHVVRSFSEFTRLL